MKICLHFNTTPARIRYSALCDAVCGGNFARIQWLLDQTPGVDVDLDRRDAPHSLTMICHYKFFVKLLRDRGGAVTCTAAALNSDGANEMPLHVACSNEVIKANIVTMLREHGAVDAPTAEDRESLLTLACRIDSNLGVVQLLINAGADVNIRDGVFAPLHYAAGMKTFKYLIYSSLLALM